MADQLTPNDWRALDANGDPVSGALAYWYEAGTSTPLTVYTTSALTTPHASPQVADANGVFTQIFVASGTAAKVDVKDPDTAASLPGYPQDNVPISSSAASAASISFDAVTGNAADNVQDGIANVTADILAIENQAPIYVTAGSSDAYTITTTTPITAYATGQTFRLRINRDNTGAVTLNVDGVGAKDVQSYDSANSLTALASGQWQIGQIIDVTYDGTRFVQQNPLAMPSAEAATGTADFPRLIGADVLKSAIETHAPAESASIAAWVQFNGTGTPTINGSYNVSSITDLSVGQYRINFTNNLAHANFAAIGTAGTGLNYVLTITARAVGSVTVDVRSYGVGAVDGSDINVIVVL